MIPPNLIAYGVAAALLFGSGAYTGGKLTSNHYKAKEADRLKETADAMAAMVKRANEISKADSEAAKRSEQIRQQTRIRQQEKDHALELEAVRNHKPECRITDTQLRLFNGAIDDANGVSEAPTSSSLPSGLRSHATDERSGGQGRMGLGLKGNQRIWRMSLEAS